MEQFAMSPGTMKMPQLCVYNLDYHDMVSWAFCLLAPSDTPFLTLFLHIHSLFGMCSDNLLFPSCIVGAINISASDYFSEGTSPGLVTNIICSGSETDLLQCTHNTSRGLSCDPAGVICQGILYPHINSYDNSL